MNVGWPGRVHDARVFGNSELYHKGETNDLFPQKAKKLVCPGKEIAMPIVLLVDAAYPLKKQQMSMIRKYHNHKLQTTPWHCEDKPDTNRANLIAAQTVFNYRLSRARMTIESTFGRLKGDVFKRD